MKVYKSFADLKLNDVAYLLVMEHNRWVIKEMNVFEHNENQLEFVDGVYHIIAPKENKVFAEVDFPGINYLFADFNFIEDVVPIMFFEAEYAIKNFKDNKI